MRRMWIPWTWVGTMFVGCSSPSDTGGGGEPVKLAVLAAPKSALPDETLSGITVEVQDGEGRRQAVAVPVQATLDGAGGVLSGTTQLTTTGGRAIFTDLSIDGLGARTLQFTSPGLTSASHQLGIVVGPPQAGEARPLAIVHATVLPMTGGGPLVNHTIVAENGLITGFGPDGQVPIPANATVIDGTGRWVTPGLVDFHAHERGFPAWPDDVEGNFVMYLANGVTSIVNMGDFTGGLLPWRDRVRAGTAAGPDAWVGQIVRGQADGGTPVVTNAASALQVAQQARQNGYDFLKVYNAVPAEAFTALVDGGQVEGLAVTGHASTIGLRHAIANGQVMVAHVLEFQSLAGNGSAGVVAALAQEVAASGTTVTPTLHVVDVIRSFGLDALAGRNLNERIGSYPGAEYMDDAALTTWQGVLVQRGDIRTPIDRTSTFQLAERLTLAFHLAGVPLLMGTDNIGIPAVVPGFSVQAELALLAGAGIPAEEVLEIATRNAGRFINQHFGAPHPVGVIAPGARADLVLMDQDPRTDFGAYVVPAGVMAGGRWYSREWLRDQLERLRFVR